MSLTYKFIALGLGQCSSVLPFLKNSLYGLEYDEIIFCDTGKEHPLTYAHLEVMQSIFDITILKTEVVKPHPPLCTKEAKILPVRRYLRSKGIDEAFKYLGMTTNEKHRMKQNSIKWIRNEYPLIEFGFSRATCQKFLLENLGYVPIRSGCIDCPYRKRAYDRWVQEVEA